MPVTDTDRMTTATSALHQPTGVWCAGCGDPILHGQSAIRLEAGLVLRGDDGPHFDALLMRPTVYLHSGGGYDAGYDVEDRWCATPEGFAAALALLSVHGEAGASGH